MRWRARESFDLDIGPINERRPPIREANAIHAVHALPDLHKHCIGIGRERARTRAAHPGEHSAYWEFQLKFGHEVHSDYLDPEYPDDTMSIRYVTIGTFISRT